MVRIRDGVSRTVCDLTRGYQVKRDVTLLLLHRAALGWVQGLKASGTDRTERTTTLLIIELCSSRAGIFQLRTFRNSEDGECFSQSWYPQAIFGLPRYPSTPAASQPCGSMLP